MNIVSSTTAGNRSYPQQQRFFQMQTARPALNWMEGVIQSIKGSSVVTRIMAGLIGLMCAIFYLSLSLHSPNSAYGRKSKVYDYRVALISDAHLIGPQYECCDESIDLDNESILKTEERLRHVVASINGISPRPDAALYLGDLVHQGYSSLSNFSWYVDPANQPNAYSIAGSILRQFNMPLHMAFGNHDYKTVCGSPSDSAPRDLSHLLFQHFFGAFPYHVAHVGPYKLIMLNSMLGASWDPSSPRCKNNTASLGPTQLAWLHSQLAEGRPSLVFVHHPLPIAMRDEVSAADLAGSDGSGAAPYPDLVSTLLAHQHVVKGVFSGHYHKGVDWGDAYPFPLTTLPSTRYDTDNFLLLELKRDGSGFKILDWAKNRGGGRCSDTWTYTGSPAPASRQVETGTCGRPTTSAMDSFELPNITQPDQIPGPTGQQFVPEKSCASRFLPSALHMCLDPTATASGSRPASGHRSFLDPDQQDSGSSAVKATPSDDKWPNTQRCCDILGVILRPSSTTYAGSCMCQPGFYEAARALFAKSGRDLDEVLLTCTQQFGKDIQYPGKPGGSCLDRQGRLPPPQ